MIGRKPFAGFPYWWVERHIGQFDSRYSQTGVHLAALKVYIGLALDATHGSWIADSSITRLETICGISRPSVIRGRDRLDEMGLIRVERDRKPFRYQLVQADCASQFVKLPKTLLRENLRHLGRRGVVTLSALKIYLTLLSLRVNYTQFARIGHDRMAERTGVQPRFIRRALDVLYSHGLIHVNPPGTSGYHRWGGMTNEYILIGLHDQP